MTAVAHPPYTVVLTGGPRPEIAAARLAKLIIDRWHPGHAGGMVLLLGPKMAKSLLPFFSRAAATGRPITLRISVPHTVPLIEEVSP
jgi:hypothetical protein